MKIKFHFLYLPAFLALLFLEQELHDWAHFIAAEIFCGCWGSKGFDSWTICDHCAITKDIGVFIFFAGPFATYIIIWSAWWLMSHNHTGKQRSAGFALLFAAIPFVRILAAMAGGGDETRCLRELFQNADGSNRHIVALAGLFFVCLLTIPALLRAFILLPGLREKVFLFPIFLVVPMYVHQWILKGLMTKLLERGFLNNEVFPGIPILVIAWAFLWIMVLWLTYKNLLNFFEKAV